MTDRIIRIERAVLRGTRPRSIGYNARIPTHGPFVTDAAIRITTASGASGLGWSRIDRGQAESLLGRSIEELFELPAGSKGDGNLIDLPLWDIVAKLHEKPLYQLLGAAGYGKGGHNETNLGLHEVRDYRGTAESPEVELYDGSIYIDDLGVPDDEAKRIFQEEVRSGQVHGYRNFKIKIGRGARWMPMQEGLERDILVIHAVREAAGPESKILIDANMGNTLNSAKVILRECADVGIYWFEEPFAEDAPLNQGLKAFIKENGYGTLVADGEFHPPPYFFDLVEKGWIDVVQHDFRALGLTWWRATAERIRPWGARCGPHTWGSVVERFPHAHFAASVPHYSLLEAAPVDIPGLVTDGWEMRDGKLIVPELPGCGFDIEPEAFQKGVQHEKGFSVSR